MLFFRDKMENVIMRIHWIHQFSIFIQWNTESWLPQKPMSMPNHYQLPYSLKNVYSWFQSEMKSWNKVQLYKLIWYTCRSTFGILRNLSAAFWIKLSSSASGNSSNSWDFVSSNHMSKALLGLCENYQNLGLDDNRPMCHIAHIRNSFNQ